MLGRFPQADVTAMSDDIPFDKNLELAPDTVDEPMPGVRRVMANNPGPVHLQGHGQLHPRHAARSPSSIPVRTIPRISARCSMPCATRR